MNVMKSLFEAFEEGNIPYLHFKSNRNLDKSFMGKADFDVLVDPLFLPSAQELILRFGGKRHNNIRFGNYPGVDNWLIFDKDTGVVYHLHLHCQLATGKRLIKDYVIPWREILLENRIKDESFGIYTAPPELELLLLTFRSVVKKRAFKGAFSYGMEEERRYLAKSSNEKLLVRYACELLSPGDGERIAKAVMGQRVGSGDFSLISRCVRKKLALFRRMSGVRAYFSSLGDYWGKLVTKKVNRYFGGYFPTAKTPEAGGAIVAFVGIDGAGKSTLLKNLGRWMKSSKIDFRGEYMGTGDGKVTPYVQAMKNARSALVKEKGKKPVERIWFFKSPIKYIKRLIKLSMLYDVEKNNHKKLVRMNRYRMNGGITLCDRYPQTQMPDKNDGPKVGGFIKALGENFLTKSFARKEAELLSIVDEVRPDIVFRLLVEPEEGLRRKGDEITEASVAAHRRKMEALLAIEYRGSVVEDIDTTGDFETELLHIKTLLWKYI
jgi:hypothetical protein